ncbi:hypothetical protein BST81_12055 [Leptolyngbya sp. 'hensonii']|nr:hypothetical protein BST81_12055 [Leptolyngbya sp. 'hensonii']
MLSVICVVQWQAIAILLESAKVKIKDSLIYGLLNSFTKAQKNFAPGCLDPKFLSRFRISTEYIHKKAPEWGFGS